MSTLAQLARAARLRVVGLMSGTSADGVDAAVVDVTRRGFELLAFKTYPYPSALRAAVMKASDRRTGRVDEICHLNFALGEVFASAAIRLAAESGVGLESVDLIGSHGQTIHHLPTGRRHGRRMVRSTLQIAEPSVIAERTGITTVADFRPRDLAAGGQGAPLVAYVDWRLFTHKRRGRVMLNVGGIANVTYLPPDGGLDEVLAFDTGPGNMVVDRLIERASRGRRRFDRGGRIARQGTVRAELLSDWLAHPYFRRCPPKTTGREQFGRSYADALARDARARGVRGADLVATATALTARSIAEACRRFLPGEVDEVFVSGGGARNAALIAMLAERLAPAKVAPTDALGLNGEAKEAVAFAVLAADTVRGRPNNAPAATGASRGVVLGKIIPAGP